MMLLLDSMYTAFLAERRRVFDAEYSASNVANRVPPLAVPRVKLPVNCRVQSAAVMWRVQVVLCVQ